jgi:glycosyltransferase involved in cell wall biosynthesis
MGEGSANGGPNRVTLVVTRGFGSLDYYAQKLADKLPVPKIHTDLYQRSAELFNVPLASSRAVAALLRDAAFVRRLRKADGVLHLPNHHFGRYARFRSGRYLITVHDLIRYFDLHDGNAPLIHRPNARDRAYLALDYAGIRMADHVIAVSEATKRDIVRQLGIREADVTVVHQGIDHDVFRPVDRRYCEGRYVLFVGSEHPRKNLRTLFSAFRKLKADARFRDVKLVKAGSPGGPESAFRDATLAAVTSLGLEDDVVLTGRVREEELPVLYSGAECLVLPSLYEGFGLPPLEAMACGCPVVVSNASSLPEVAGHAALQVEARDHEALAAAIETILTDRVRREDLRERGLERAQHFSWERTAHETLRVYERLV